LKNEKLSFIAAPMNDIKKQKNLPFGRLFGALLLCLASQSTPELSIRYAS
jgi:hypothetical protein